MSARISDDLLIHKVIKWSPLAGNAHFICLPMESSINKIDDSVVCPSVSCAYDHQMWLQLARFYVPVVYVVFYNELLKQRNAPGILISNSTL